MPDNDATLFALLETTHLGVLSTIKRDGRPQMSPVSFAYYPDRRLIKVSVTDSRAKVANLRRDPRASFTVLTGDGWGYCVAEGTAELTPVSTEPDDATADELVEIYRNVLGEHPDWDDFRRAMIADHRLVLRLPVDRVYGWVRG